MYYKSAGSIISIEQARGKLLEDLICMYLTRFLFTQTVKFLAYDGAQGGADFIIGFGDKKIVIEVGASEKGYKQVAKTAEKGKPNYSLVISDGRLDYSEEYNAVKIPLKMFLLL